MWLEAANIDAVHERRGTKTTVDGEEIVLFKVDGTICAVRNMCPHQRFQQLHDGMFQHGIVTCPMHGWAYDVRTGVSTNASGRLTVYATRVEHGKIFVDLHLPSFESDRS